MSLAGPALRLTVGARRLELPLGRISRIVVRGRVDWRADALAACLRERVAVLFLDGRGETLGAALPMRATQGSLDELIRSFLELERWHELYSNWLRSQRMRILRRWRAAREQRGQPLTEADWREAVRRHLYLREPPDHATDTSLEAAACYGLTSSLVAAAGARTQYRAWNGGVLALAADLAGLLALQAALERGALASAFAHHPPLWAGGIEAGLAERRSLLLELLGRLRANLSEWVEPWP